MTEKNPITQAYEGAIELNQVAREVEEAITQLDKGEIRVAEQKGGEWVVNSWVSQAIVLYFRLAQMLPISGGDLQWYDRVPPKRDLVQAGIRVVPPGVVRYGAFCEPGVVVMPGYVNIGAYIGSGTLVDTWATVGSGAQIGTGVHLSGGVGIGGVLEPPGSRPVIIEDGAFIGSRSIIVEGVLVENEAVLGANTVITASTPIIDVTGPEPVEIRGRVPARSVVIPGSRPKVFPAGEYQIPCALVIGRRTSHTDQKTTLNQALREFEVPV